MKAHFAVSYVTEKKQAADFSAKFGVELERLPQGPGVAGDYEIVNTSEHTLALEKALGFPVLGKVLEFKDDKTSLKYGTFFVEYEQTSDWWMSRKPSGHELAMAKGCILVISSGPRNFVFNQTQYAELVKGVTRILSTKFRSNGNNPGSFTHGKIVPVARAVETASVVYNVSEQSGLQAVSF